MPSGNTGKIIQALTVKKKTVDLVFLDGETLTLTHDLYTQQYYYVGKVLDDQTLANLKEAIRMQPLLTYAFGLLNKGKYSEYQVREKLYRREAKKPQVDEIIHRLKQAHLLEDAQLMKEWENHYRLRHYGPRWIQEKLYQKGFSSSLVKTMMDENDQSLNSVQSLVPTLLKKYRTRSAQAQKEIIKLRLQARGFSHHIIQKVLQTQPDNLLDQEMDNLKNDFEKITKRYQNRYQGKMLQEKIINFLLGKGYNYPNIKRFIKESHDAD